jgi:hypothetical protein
LHRAEDHAADKPGDSAGIVRAPATVDRRRPTVARFRFQPDPRRLRTLLAEVDVGLDPRDSVLRRNVRLLVGEIVARLLTASPRTAVELELEVKADSVRIDIRQAGDQGSDFWDALDRAVFSDLTSAWGRDRRVGGGVWFEIAAPGRVPARHRDQSTGLRLSPRSLQR